MSSAKWGSTFLLQGNEEVGSRAGAKLKAGVTLRVKKAGLNLGWDWC